MTTGPPPAQDLGRRLSALEAELLDDSALSAQQLSHRLFEVNDLATQINAAPAAEHDAFATRVNHLRREYIDWLHPVQILHPNPRCPTAAAPSASKTPPTPPPKHPSSTL